MRRHSHADPDTSPAGPAPAVPARRRFAAGALALAAGAAAGLAARPAAAASPLRTPMTVWKSPTCGCCGDWIEILEKAGFQITVNDTGNTAVRQRLRIPVALGSCHTAQVAGYAIEGHVPAADVRRLLAERPAGAVGLAVPGMPIGSPGMDGPEYGGRRDRYDTLLVLADGSHRVFATHNLVPVAAAGAAAAGSAAAPAGDWAEAEVRRVDREAGRLNLRHGEIKSLDMPPMTMVFTLRDRAGIEGLKAGDRIRFQAVKEGSNYVVTAWQKVAP